MVIRKRRPSSSALPQAGEVAQLVPVSRKTLEATVAHLSNVHSVVVTAAMALCHQNADLDSDVAAVLRLQVANALSSNIHALNAALDPQSATLGARRPRRRTARRKSRPARRSNAS